MKTVNDFKMNEYAYKPITADGSISYYSGKYDINYSSILSALIVEAGKYCESFASDLFIDWKSVCDFIENAEENAEKIYLFGFRKYGVDHDTFILNRYENNEYTAQYEYRSLWRLDIKTTEKDIEMKLGRVF